MPSGTGVPGDPETKHREARRTFFREAWRQKINPKLEELEDVDERIEYLLFVRYDATENQHVKGTEEAEQFVDRLDEKLRELYRDRFNTVRNEIEDRPLETQKGMLKKLLLTERQRPHSNESPSFEHITSLVEDEIEKIEVQKQTEGEAQKIAHERRRDNSERMMDWEINAAQLYAYVQEYGQPSSMKELQEETKVSPRQAWDKLKEQGYGIGEGVTGLVSALEEWAPEFEEEYGLRKARQAASPFNWPDEHE
jgi:hypothetical protein